MNAAFQAAVQVSDGVMHVLLGSAQFLSEPGYFEETRPTGFLELLQNCLLHEGFMLEVLPSLVAPDQRVRGAFPVRNDFSANGFFSPRSHGSLQKG